MKKLEDGIQLMQDKILRNKRIILLLFLAFFIVTCAFSQSEDKFEGLWIRKNMSDGSFDPFKPSFVMIDKLEENYLVVFMDSVVVDGTVMAEFFHHIYRKENNILINEMSIYESKSTLEISENLWLIETIIIPGSSEYGENIFVRPSQDDFQQRIEWYGYKLE